LEIFNSQGDSVRRYSSDDQPRQINEKDYAVPSYWYRPPQVLSNKAGMQRFVWDLMYTSPNAFSRGFPISAIYKDTPLYPQGPAVLPGSYTVKLTVNGKTLSQPLTVKMDPRVKTDANGLSRQLELSIQAYNGMMKSFSIVEDIRKLRNQIKTVSDRAGQGP